MKVETWRYAEPNGKGLEGWYIAFLDSSGALSVQSDYGNYSYRWNAFGFDGNFRRFLSTLNNGYVISKLCPARVFDGESTRKKIQHEIKDLRRHMDIDKDAARYEWDLLADCHDLDDESDFARWAENTELKNVYEGDFYSTMTDPAISAFMEKVWPRLMAKIRDDLSGGSKCPACKGHEDQGHTLDEDCRLKLPG
jgi:hypothetical protein